MMGIKPQRVEQFAHDMYIEDVYFGRLMAARGPVGVLVVGLHRHSDQKTQELLARVTEAVSKAVENKILQEENERILQKLRLTNAKLRALDETKDEFITMASHQLRTPLTSVKGYLSMVLEGDAGKLNINQTKLLEQSYTSSQRMVYLISDLLNLSRLSTGKFVIESTPVDLSEVVQLEVDQLAETAKARGLTLAYQPPATFPLLMLDETKIHQVVMNFIDNAIYYTPSGGKVTVALHETPTAVECTVRDTGIGVPRAVQHKLFTKFYRAANAQQVRPDGTGLGLFMARKVIAAQGGAIIFQSEEGKGSTFGFRFNKARRLVSDVARPPAPKQRT
jgi:signal transduction histidine kinase